MSKRKIALVAALLVVVDVTCAVVILTLLLPLALERL